VRLKAALQRSVGDRCPQSDPGLSRAAAVRTARAVHDSSVRAAGTRTVAGTGA